MKYARPIVVVTAPALFEFLCVHPGCDGEHDLTLKILGALRESRELFTSRSNCDGLVRDLPCDRTMTYTCEATYKT